MRRPSRIKNLQATFLAGLFLLAPVWVTYVILRGIYDKVSAWSPFGFWGGTILTLVVILLSILFIGWLSRTALGSILTVMDDAMTRVPGINLVYNAVRDLVKAFGGGQKGFTQPVWIKLSPRSKIRMIGFITRQDLSSLGAKGDVAVYLPHSYAISGMVIFMPRNQVKPVQTQNRDVFAFLATGGLSGASIRSKDEAPIS